MITRLGSRSVTLTAWAPDNRAGLTFDGVRHSSDPDLRDHPGYDGGCWDYASVELRLQIQEQLIQELLSRNEAIEDHVATLHRAVDDLRKSLGV